MAARIPALQRTREELTALIEGRLSTASAKDELIKLASRLIVEEALEAEAGDALGRDYYEHGAQPLSRARRGLTGTGGTGWCSCATAGCLRRPSRSPACEPKSCSISTR
jgi:hypothetical protein